MSKFSNIPVCVLSNYTFNSQKRFTLLKYELYDIQDRLDASKSIFIFCQIIFKLYFFI